MHEWAPRCRLATAPETNMDLPPTGTARLLPQMGARLPMRVSWQVIEPVTAVTHHRGVQGGLSNHWEAQWNTSSSQALADARGTGT